MLMLENSDFGLLPSPENTLRIFLLFSSAEEKEFKVGRGSCAVLKQKTGRMEVPTIAVPRPVQQPEKLVCLPPEVTHAFHVCNLLGHATPLLESGDPIA